MALSDEFLLKTKLVSNKERVFWKSNIYIYRYLTSKFNIYIFAIKYDWFMVNF